MKMLILMPLDEKWVYAATGIYKEIEDEMKTLVFFMPMMMEYLIQTKIAPDWATAAVETIYSACQVYEAAGDDDLVIIGNLPTSYKFDIIHNFQDIEEALPYKDLFIEKLSEVCHDTLPDTDIVFKYIDNLHKAEESDLALQDCEATAHLISAILKPCEVN